MYSDRSKELIYDNGTKKITLENGYSIVYFKNGDIKQVLLLLFRLLLIKLSFIISKKKKSIR